MSPQGQSRLLDVLARAGQLLVSSPDVVDSLAKVAELCVAELGTFCAIEIAVEAIDRSEIVVTAGVRAEFSGDECTVAEPLAAGRRRFGTLVCQTTEPGGFPADVRQTLRVLALELSVGIAGHLAIQREHRVADSFQRALLPDEFPHVEGAVFRAAYRPASDEADVGGDWYDTFALGDGRIAISVGDVAGHGLDAAVIMGEVRQAMRTAAVAASSPAAVLEHVNGAVRLQESIGMVTAIFATYDPLTSMVCYAVAGHPPPILALSNGFSRALPYGGIPLGCASHAGSTNWTFTLPENATIAFYTDGLTENERDLVSGEEKLALAVRDVAGSANPDTAERILQSILGDGANRDDAAVLLLTRTTPISSYTFSAVPIVSPLSRAIVDRVLQSRDVGEDKRFGVLVSVGEAVANSVEHAYNGVAPGLMHLRIETDAAYMRLTIEDFGRWRPFVKREERGRGIELMHAFSDGVQIRSTRESTTISIKVRL